MDICDVAKKICGAVHGLEDKDDGVIADVDIKGDELIQTIVVIKDILEITE